MINIYLLVALFSMPVKFSKKVISILLPHKGCFLVLRKLLLVSFCVVVWVLFSVFSIFCITSLVSATPRNYPHKGEPKLWWAASATASHFKITQFLHKNSSAPYTGSSFPYK